MKSSLYAQFKDPVQAERALANLIDVGGKATNLTALFPSDYQGRKFSALAPVVIPGLGLIAGGGALAATLTKLSGPNAFAAMAGGLVGCLRDQGLPHQIALDTARALKGGDAVLAIECPTGKLRESEVMQVLGKYQAHSFGRTGTVRKVIFAI